MIADNDAVAANRRAWDASAEHHKGSDYWRQLSEAAGRVDFNWFDDTMTGLLAGIGIAGKDVIQLCCNNGRECLSLAGLGAASVVGIDQSSAFLAQARELAALSPHEAGFIEADVYALPAQLRGGFDVAVVTIGVLNWMPDLDGFMKSAASTLRPGGMLAIYETHPVLDMFEPASDDPYKVRDSYFRRAPHVDDAAIVYDGAVPEPGATSYWFPHTLGALLTATLEAGLTIRHFREYPHSNREAAYDVYDGTSPALPMCFTLTAEKAR